MENSPIKAPTMTLTSGPVAIYPRVQEALSRPVPYDYDPYFQDFYEQVSLKAGKAMRSDKPAIILHAEPAVAIEAAAASLISAQDTVLNLASGVYGKGFGYWAARYCKRLTEVEVAYNEAIDPEQVAEALRANPDVTIVSTVHHDTPSGTLNPVNEIGEVVKAHGALHLVDAVSSFAGMDIHPIDCAADIFITGPGKCLGGSPGLSVLDVSEAAWAHMEGNETSPRASVLSLLDWKDAWRKENAFPFTPSVAEVQGLDAALDQYLEEGPEAVWRRHDLTARACRAGIKAMGLELWPARESIAAPSTTAVTIPGDLTTKQIHSAARQTYGVTLSAGRHETYDKLIRIGHMGPVAEPIYAIAAVAVFGAAVRQHGIAADVGAGVEAAMAEIPNGT
ncbi:MAG: Pyridoxamine--pyruvate transaminase [Alphaproteobacteria bacterium MarineAlpha10_Bin2]|nr:MAG: Pyridoxamine--pyruvate transaminase [Alphaproteobacteria bacterium MarineAlpha10_Bin2]